MGTTEQRGAQTPELVNAESIGRFLSRERQVREIGIDELAALTRLPKRSLERLESGVLDGVNDGFTRGLVRTVAEAIGLPADATVARMLPEAQRTREVGRYLPRLGFLLRFLGVVPISAWLVMLAALVAVVWFAGGIAPAPPEPLLYRRDAVRELWLLQQQHSSWLPAPALATSVSPTVEPETPRALLTEDGGRGP